MKINKPLGPFAQKLFVVGNSDKVTCFMCGVASGDWSINETPWKRHARSSPKCQYVMSQKGEEFVGVTLEEYGEYIDSEKDKKTCVSLERL